MPLCAQSLTCQVADGRLVAQGPPCPHAPFIYILFCVGFCFVLGHTWQLSGAAPPFALRNHSWPGCAWGPSGMPMMEPGVTMCKASILPTVLHSIPNALFIWTLIVPEYECCATSHVTLILRWPPASPSISPCCHCTGSRRNGRRKHQFRLP